ncbi:MAG: hypothetical protein ACTS73_04530 [Arsenophonus sp. NEOnobi-MAG3]
MLLIKPLIFVGKVFSEVSTSAMKKLEKNREELLAFYEFPLTQLLGPSIKTLNPIESVFCDS